MTCRQASRTSPDRNTSRFEKGRLPLAWLKFLFAKSAYPAVKMAPQFHRSVTLSPPDLNAAVNAAVNAGARPSQDGIRRKTATGWLRPLTGLQTCSEQKSGAGVSGPAATPGRQPESVRPGRRGRIGKLMQIDIDRPGAGSIVYA